MCNWFTRNVSMFLFLHITMELFTKLVQRREHLFSFLFIDTNLQHPVQESSKVPVKSSQIQATSHMMTEEPQKPITSTSSTQPQSTAAQNSIAQSISNAKSAILQRTSSITSKTLSSTEQVKDKLPQIPPRVQSQSSIKSTVRGPPPAIPPRQNVSMPARSSSVQAPTSVPQNRPQLVRQPSANSIVPQCTRQPAPEFVIPLRQNSRTSLNRSGSIGGS